MKCLFIQEVRKKHMKPLPGNDIHFSQGDEGTEALMLKVKQYALPAKLELKPACRLVSRKSLLQHIKMPAC